MAHWCKGTAIAVVACLTWVGAAAAQPAPGGRAAPHTVVHLRSQLAHAAALGTLTRPRTITVTGTGFSAHAMVAVAQCSTGALAAALKATTSALDFCDQSRVAAQPSDGAGGFALRTVVHPEIQTPSGPVDCRPAGACLLGALNLGVLQGAPLQVAILPLSFSPTATEPSPASPQIRFRIPITRDSITATRPARRMLLARPAGALGDGRIGLTPRLPTRPLPRRPLSGEGLLALTMMAPRTSWSSAADTSVVAEVSVDRRPFQQIVLFEGATPFTYEAFTGPLRTGPHLVRVRIRPDLSHVTSHAPVARLLRVSLAVVAPTTALGTELAHAPVMFGRAVSPTRDTPLMTYATDDPVTGSPGLRRLTYVVTWSHETAGTGFVPWLEWGTWGRMTDIETAIAMDVDAQGHVSRSTYLGCVTCGPDFPPNRTALDETDVPFTGHYFAGHPILRVATGNNDFSDVGTTPLRFQLGLSAPPPSGATREGAMDRNPWTYGVMGQELPRIRADYSTDPASTAAGDARQYLTVDLDTSTQAAAAVGVDLRLAGSSTVYTNDFGTTYPLYGGGHGRTVVKVPLGRAGARITLLRLRLLPASAGASPTIAIHRVRVLQYVGGRIVVRQLPAVQTVVEPQAPPTTVAPAIAAASTGP